jgi:NTP pyrophosphatase (non-canonical NTP hydrolase)
VAGSFAFGSKVMPGTAKLLEEQGELVQVLAKYMMTGGDSNHWSGDLRPRLLDEMGDVYAALAFFSQHNLTPEEIAKVEDRLRAKLALFEQWHKEQG